MKDENRIYWDKIKQPPPSNMKTIGAGRLKGMSSIDPMWRIMAMTEVFGPCGIGWKYEIVRHWESETFDPKLQKLEKSAHVETLLFYKHNGEWSEGIPGLGGSMLLAQEKNGPHHSDESFKMALTDSLSVAMKSIGMAADIYMGKFDGTKYNNVPDQLNEPRPMTDEQETILLGFLDRLNKEQHAHAPWLSGKLKQGMTDVKATAVINQIKDKMKW